MSIGELKHIQLPESLALRTESSVRVVELYRQFIQRVIKSAPSHVQAFEDVLVAQLVVLPSPEFALVHLDRFIESTFSASSFIHDVVQHPVLLELFFRLVCSSNYLADVLVRDPELFRWITSTESVSDDEGTPSYMDSSRETFARFQSHDRRLDALKRFQRRTLLRIAMRDIMGKADLKQTTRHLSALADSIVCVLLDEAIRLVEKRYGYELHRGIVIFALGKLGGNELNYSSDIDLMVLYDRNDALSESFATHDLVLRVVEQLIRFLTDVTSEGFFYRTDFRLRPDGNAGPLAISFAAAKHYYESRGQLWERQMLIKARVIAGNTQSGESFLEELRPFVYPRTPLFPVSKLLSDISRRLSERWDEELNVKHCKGGIRMIEFSVQALQMLFGPKENSIGVQGTLDALARLVEKGIVAEDEGRQIEDCYRTLRRIEHAVQLEAFEQTHTIPSNEGKRTELAMKLGFDSGDQFMSEFQRVRETVIRFYEQVFSTTDHSSPAMSSRLSDAGFRDPVKAEGLLDSMRRGDDRRPVTLRQQERIDAMLGQLLEVIGGENLPDECFSELVLLFSRTPSPDLVLSMLESPNSRRLLIRLAAHAPAFLRKVTMHPIVFESLVGGWSAQSMPADDLHTLKLLHETDALGRFLCGDISFEECTRRVTEVSDHCLTTIAQRVAQSYENPAFAIIALGKYGAFERIPGSDLDIVFIFEPSEKFQAEYAQELATKLLSELQSTKGGSMLYEVDARLRPEGRNSPLAVSFDSYRNYWNRRAEFWERMALIRSRCVAGNERLCNELDEFHSGIRRETSLGKEQIESVIHLRRRMEPVTRFNQRDFFDLKLSSGGLVDIEFFVQLQLIHCQLTAHSLGNTLSALRALADYIPEHFAQVQSLEGDYRTLRVMQLYLRVLLDTPSNVVPPQIEKRALLARAMDWGNVAEFDAFIRTLRTRVRKAFDAMTAGYLNS